MADDDRTYSGWMNDLFLNPFSCGAKGIFLYLVALPGLLVCGVAGLSIFPPGRYPKIVLILPGLLLRMVAIYIYGFIVYKLPAFLAVPLSILLSVIASYFSYMIGCEIVGQFMTAI